MKNKTKLSTIMRAGFRFTKKETLKLINYLHKHATGIRKPPRSLFRYGFTQKYGTRGYFQNLLRFIGLKRIGKVENYKFLFTLSGGKRFETNKITSLGNKYIKGIKVYGENFRTFKHWDYGEFDCLYWYYGLITQTKAGFLIYFNAESKEITYEEAFERLGKLAEEINNQPNYIKGSTDPDEIDYGALGDMKGADLELFGDYEPPKYSPFSKYRNAATLMGRRVYLKSLYAKRLKILKDKLARWESLL